MDHESSELLEQLKDPSPARRAAAANTLRKFEPVQPQIITALIDASDDAERDVRVSAVKALVGVWRTLNAPAADFWIYDGEADQFFELANGALKKRLRDEDKYVRVAAAEGLRELYCSDQEVFDVFVAAAYDQDESLRSRAALAFWLGASDTRASLWQVKTEAGLKVLVDLLQDDHERVRNDALNAVKSVALTEKVTAPGLPEVLDKLLQDPDQQVRFNAACALSSTGVASPAALQILMESLGQADSKKRKAAAFALRKMGADVKPALPALIAALKDTEVKVRARAAEALGKFGTTADDLTIKALLEAELEAERNSDRELSVAVKRALAMISKDQIAAAQNRAAAYKARDFFPLFGFKPEEIPFWILMLWDPDANQRARAVTALGYLGATEAIPELRRLLKDDDEDVRRRVVDVLQRFGDAGEFASKQVP